MNRLNYDEELELRSLRNLIRERKANAVQMQRFLDLLFKSSPVSKKAVETEIMLAGYSDPKQFIDELMKKKSSDTWGALIALGGAVLAGYGLKKYSDYLDEEEGEEGEEDEDEEYEDEYEEVDI